MKRSQVKREMVRLAARERERSPADQSRVDRVAALAAGACRISMKKKNRGFLAFVIRQVRYTGRYVWIWQALLLLLLLSAFDRTAELMPLRDPEFGLFLGRRIPVILCGAGLLSAWSCVPFFARSRMWGMTEVEAASTSLSRLRTAQLFIAGGSAVLMELCVAVGAGMFWTVGAGSLAAWLFLPFLLAWNLILLLLDRGRERYFAISSSALMGAGFLLFVFVWRHVSRGAAGPQDYVVTSWYVWILCGAAALLWIFQIWRLGRKENDKWSYA